ncbi:MAG: class I SAM-dependent methyltransferase [Deltaproteobacteria bacterium]|nr:class I SAM-dependent methyltransferase [Deltaproteobacteria bacterium]
MTPPGNTFARGSAAYALARPRYPRALIDWLLDHTSERRAAWDCATGNGQAAVDLAPHFDLVHATDISREQVMRGTELHNVRYSVQPAECTSFGPGSFDLVTVAQALHWFDLPRFWTEVKRVARPGAFFCAWGYAWLEGPAELEVELVSPVRELVAPYWAPQLRMLWQGYRADDLAFPFEPVPAPDLAIRVRWTVAQLIDYLRTWSAHQRGLEDPAVGRSLGEVETRALRRLEARGEMELTMPLAVVAGRVW